MTSRNARLEATISLRDRFTRGIQNAGRELSGFGRRAEDVGKRLSSAGQSFTSNLTIPMAAVGIALAKLSQQASRLQIQEAFERQAKRVGISANDLVEALRGASAGTVAANDLMLAANRAFALQVAKDIPTFVSLMEIARDRSRIMGISVTQAFNDIVTGLGRGSALILDNLGIILSVKDAYIAYATELGKTASKLTTLEQKQAIINATLKQGTATMDKASLAIKSQAEEYAAMRAELSETVDVLLQNLLPVLAATVGVFTALPKEIQITTIALLGLALAAGPVVQGVGAMISIVGIMMRVLRAYRVQLLLTRIAQAAVFLGPLGILAGVVALGAGALLLKRATSGGGADAATAGVRPPFKDDGGLVRGPGTFRVGAGVTEIVRTGRSGRMGGDRAILIRSEVNLVSPLILSRSSSAARQVALLIEPLIRDNILRGGIALS